MVDEKDQLIYNLETEVRRLRDENKKLEDTVQWMHDLIWQMVREREGIESCNQSMDTSTI